MESKSKRRRRATLVCEMCRKRKVKCDRGDPCFNCKTYKAKCVYGLAEETSHLQATAQSSPDVAVVGRGNASHAGSVHGDSTVYSTTGERTSSVLTPAYDDVQPVNGSIKRRLDDLQSSFEYLSSRVRLLESKKTRETAQLSPDRSRTKSSLIVNKTRVLGWSIWSRSDGVLDLVKDCYAKALGDTIVKTFNDPEIQPYLREMARQLHQIKVMAKIMKADNPSRSLIAPVAVEIPVRYVADQAVVAYFQFFESSHRILHQPTFQQRLNTYWNDPSAVTIILKLEIALVVAIGSSVLPNRSDDPIWRRTIEQWIYAAHCWLAGPIEKDRLTISAIQIHCLLLLARQVWSIGGDLIWASSGSLVQRAMQMGFHRDPKYFSQMSLLQAEIRRRLWYTILEIAIQASYDAALPLRISLDDYDTEQPINVDDSDMNDKTESCSEQPDRWTSMSLQLMLCKFIAIRIRVLDTLNRIALDSSPTGLQELIDELYKAKAWISFRLDSSPLAIDFYIPLMRFLVDRFILPLFSYQPIDELMGSFHRQKALTLAIDLCDFHMSPQFEVLMKNSGGLFRGTFRTASSIISLELISRAKKEQNPIQPDLGQAQYNHVKQTMERITNFSLDRIRGGETNVKHHMFFTMILAYAEASRNNQHQELEIAKSAKDSLALSYAIIEGRFKSAGRTTSAIAEPQLTDWFSKEYDFSQDVDDYLLPDMNFLW